MSNQEINALISLLDDPDKDVFKTVEEQIISKGRKVASDLEAAWENSDNEYIRERIELLLHKINYNDTVEKFESWINNGGEDLLEGAYLIAKYQYPEIEYNDILKKVNQVQNDIWIEFNDNLTALEKIRLINHFIFNYHSFKRTEDDLSPKGSFINLILDTKKGSTVGLAVLYTIIAQRLGLPVYGVELPHNFVLAYGDSIESESPKLDNSEKLVLFYINPVNNGSVFPKSEIDRYLKNQKTEPQESFYLPCSNTDTIKNLLVSLLHSYKNKGENQRAEELKKLFKLIAQAQQK